MKILVLGGGNSPEREVSLRSAAAVREALVELGHEVVAVDPGDGMDTVKAAARECELALPILHGTGGEDGSIQRVLEEAGVPYLGAGVAASELCFDKARLKDLLVAHDILTPQSEMVDATTFERSELVKRPFVLKPNDGGSSVDMLLARKLPFDAERARELLERYGTMLLEELIEGVEITVPVLGAKALPVIEIVPPEGGEFDYENKYNGKTAEICPAESLSAEQQKQAQRLAERVHELAGVRHVSRTDIMMTGDGQMYVLEINTIPGMTAQSLLPKSAAAAGMSWVQLVARLVELARS
jgi:D-alanine-D-alanine ligase